MVLRSEAHPLPGHQFDRLTLRFSLQNMAAVFNGNCLSSCVFIYAAAKTRSGIGDVGIHRPFANEISAESLSYAQYLEKYTLLTPVFKQYFAKYGVSSSLVDTMNITSSDDIKILSSEEMKSFGLGFKNVAAKEHEKARTIQLCGSEYHQLHLRFHATIKSCRQKMNLDQGNRSYAFGICGVNCNCALASLK